MAEHSLSQIEDRLEAVLEAWPALSGYSVTVAESIDIAVEELALPALVILTAAYDFDIADENGSAIHSATIQVEAINRTQTTGTIGRANRNALGEAILAVAADRSLGIGLQDAQETDISPSAPNGKDIGAASVGFAIKWFTPLGDHFTISTPTN
jgi:hypothetical protein